MDASELAAIIANGENSGVEFKRDGARAESVAREIVALANMRGGHVLLGVEDDGVVTGLQREAGEVEQWVINLCRNAVQPPLIPFWEVVRIPGAGVVGIVSLPEHSPDKPYRARKGNAWVTYVRVGSTSREATRDEEARLFQAAGLVRYDLKPVPGASLSALDRRRLTNYFADVLGQDCPERDDEDGWVTLLVNVDLAVQTPVGVTPSVAGMLLFGAEPHRWLPQSGITASAYQGDAADYATQDEAIIRGPLVRLTSSTAHNGGPATLKRGGLLETVEDGVIDATVRFVLRNLRSSAYLDGAVRKVVKDLPEEAVREAVVNAVAHRDYGYHQTDIEVSLYADRLEVISPGRLPNSVTVEKMKRGYRAARNELLKEVLRDYGYVEHRGMGVRNRIIAGMRAHNGTEPELIEEEDRFTVRLYRGFPPEPAAGGDGRSER